jgi:hypothetical protein
MLTDDRAPTCSLVEFLEAWNEDPNLVWQLRTGHLIHLLEAAVTRIEALEMLLSELEGPDGRRDAAEGLESENRRSATLAGEPEVRRPNETLVVRRGWIPRRARKTQT